MRPVVLIAHSLHWPNISRLSIACRNAGFSVAAIAVSDHPVHKMRSPDCTYVYSSLHPRRSLRSAIERSDPRLIIPCDDRVLRHLHALHADYVREGDPLAKLIETSLGSPEGYELLRKRSRLVELAALPDVLLPQTDAIPSFRALEAWAAIHELPAMLKLDGRTGGQDIVFLAGRAGVRNAYASMTLRRSRLRSLWNAVRLRDPEWILGDLPRGRPSVSAQSFVAGRPANCAVACWRGEVLGFVTVESLRTKSPFGPATVVRSVEGRAMRAAAASIVRHLGVSGLCGFDFMIDDRSGKAMLIEINPRATQIDHFPLAPGMDLPGLLLGALRGRPEPMPSVASFPATDIALFPQEWRRDPASRYLRAAFHDVPCEEPALLEHYGYEPSAGESEGRWPAPLDNQTRRAGVP